jgi:Uma2 family endonuclease
MEDVITLAPLITEISGEKILNGKLFQVIEGQILFYHHELKKYVITQISDEQDYIVDDYMQLPEKAPYQLINGKLIYMPAPFINHQLILNNINIEISLYVKLKKLGTVVISPCDVHFDKENAFQPDILYVSIARSSIIQKWIYGAPDFVVEILSEGTEDNDQNLKMKIYGKYNVIEYWIVDTENEQVEVYHNHQNEMQFIEKVKKPVVLFQKPLKG